MIDGFWEARKILFHIDSVTCNDEVEASQSTLSPQSLLVRRLMTDRSKAGV